MVPFAGEKNKMRTSASLVAVFAAFTLVLAFCTHAAPPPEQQTAAATGSAAPELDVALWAQGKEIKLSELKGKKYAVLFFWTISRRGTEPFAEVAKLAKEYEKKDVVFVGIGIDSADAVKNFVRLKELPFSVAADDKLVSVNLYMREHDRVPMAAVIGKDGLLYWRGQPQMLKPVLEELLSGKFDLKKNIEREAFSQSLMDAMKIKDYPTVLKLLDSGLRSEPGDLELVSLKVRLLSSLMNKPEEATAFLDELIAQQPKNLKFHQMAIIVLRESKRFKELGACFDRIIANFGDQPLTLVGFALEEMNHPIGDLRIENAYKLSQAAYRASNFKNDREKGLVSSEYARCLYYCGRPEKALEVAKEAMLLLKDTPEFEKAKSYVIFYNTVLALGKKIGQ